MELDLDCIKARQVALEVARQDAHRLHPDRAPDSTRASGYHLANADCTYSSIGPKCTRHTLDPRAATVSVPIGESVVARAITSTRSILLLAPETPISRVAKG